MKRLLVAALAAVLLIGCTAGCTPRAPERTTQERAKGDEVFRQKAGGGPGARGEKGPPPQPGAPAPQPESTQPGGPKAGEAGEPQQPASAK